MKKEIILVIFIISAIVVANFVSQNYINNFFNSISEDLNNVESKMSSNDVKTEDLEKDIEDIKNKWNDKHDYIACFIEHDLLDKVEMQFVTIGTNIKVEDYNRSIDEVEKCKFMLELIRDKDVLSTINIF